MTGADLNGRFSVRDLTYTALGAALIAVCSWVSIPTAVPFTMQTFGVFCVLSTLGGRRGTAAVAVYLALGAVGLPVFAGFKGGLGALFGLTGGYLLGFLFTGVVYRMTVAALGGALWSELLALTMGLLFCYAFGTAWFVAVYAAVTGPIGVGAALSMCVVPFILPDLAKLALALCAARRLRSAVRS